MTNFRHLFLVAALVSATACNSETVKADKAQPTEQPVATAGNKAETSQAFDKQYLIEKFAKVGLEVMEAKPSEVEGLIELTTSQGTFYSTPRADYFIPGKLFSLDDNGKFTDVVAERQAPLIADMLEEKADQMIVYPAENEMHVVTVFTDISCGYCLKLHRQIAEYNDLGITIRYLAFPRAGDQSDVADMMANIWASDDPQQAMNAVKLKNERIEGDNAKLRQSQQMISDHYELGKRIGVSGTPAVYLANGKNVGGYLSPQSLLAQIENN